MTTAEAIYRLGIVVRELVDIDVTARAIDACMRPPAEKRLVHVKETVHAILVHARETTETMAHQTVLGIHRIGPVGDHEEQNEHE
jgi:hypothetical protein